MQIVDVIPLVIKKKEYELWNHSNLESKAIISDEAHKLKQMLNLFFQSMLKGSVIAVCVIWCLDESTMEKVSVQFRKGHIYKFFAPKGDFIVLPGAFIVHGRSCEDIKLLANSWGNLERIQIIFSQKEHEEQIVRIISNDSYVYKRHSFKVLDDVMKYAKVVINDSGDGEECEIIYNKQDSGYISSFIKRLI